MPGVHDVAAETKQQESETGGFELKHLQIRNKRGELVPLAPNPAQENYEQRAGRRNIILKARQLGITTWIAAKFFLETINKPGTLTVQVAHDQRAAEAIFRIVHRFLANLPDDERKEKLKTARSNVRQIVFKELDSEYRVETAADSNAGRGSTIHNLHCSEVAMWPGDAAATLAGLRAAVPPDGTIVLESTPKGSAGAFYDEWQRAELKAHMSWLVGTGNEGKMQELEERVRHHDESLQRLRGMGAAFGVLLTLMHLAIDYLKVHRP